MSEQQLEHWAQGIREAVEQFSEANAKAKFIEHFRKSKKAMLMAEAEAKDPGRYKSAASQEVYAYRHPEYIELLEGYQEAVRVQEYRRWQLKIRELKFEEWRTEQANNRQESKRYGN